MGGLELDSLFTWLGVYNREMVGGSRLRAIGSMCPFNAFSLCTCSYDVLSLSGTNVGVLL